MKNLLTIFFMFISFGFSIEAQNNPAPFKPFEFKDYNPKWMHASIDTSVIGVQVANVGIYDGWSHLHSNNLVLKDKDYLTVIYHHAFNYFDGAYIERIDLKTGKALWTNYYDFRNTELREFPFYIQVINNELQILGVRQVKYPQLPLPKPLWLEGMFDNRTFNLSDGQLIRHIYSDESDKKSKHLVTPNLEWYGLSSHIFPVKSGIQYIKQASRKWKIEFKNYILDTNAYIIDSSQTAVDFIYKIPSNANFFKIGSEKYGVYGYYESSLNCFPDSTQVSFLILDKSLNIIKRIELFNRIPLARNYTIRYIDSSKLMLTGINEREDSSLVGFLSIVDLDGNMARNYFFLDENNLPILLSNIQVMPLKDGSGELLFGNLSKENGGTLCAFKADTSGVFKLIRKFDSKFENHYLLANNVYQIESGDILLLCDYSNPEYYGKVNNNYAKVWICIPPEDLGIKTSISNPDIIESLIIYPNPASNSISISCEDNDTSTIEIIDRVGRVVYRDKSQGCEETSIDISGYASGLYLVRLMDDEGRVLGKGKFVKE